MQTSEKTLLLSELTCLHSDPGGSEGIELACSAEGPGSVPGVRNLEKGMASHPSTLAWRIPWTEEPGGLPSIGLQGVGRD